MKIASGINSRNILAVFIFFSSLNVSAQVLTCGLKKVTINDGQIRKIEHEDGTVHVGNSVSQNWSYDGVSIKHRLFDDSIACDSKPKSRDEIISELSGRFLNNPSSYGMNNDEAELMRDYTANLMKNDTSCYLLVDAAKSVSKGGMFYIDCNDKLANPKRYWVSDSELKDGKIKKPIMPINENTAKNICNEEIKKRIFNPEKYNPSLVMGSTSRIVESLGRNVVEIDFKAPDKLGVESEYTGKCILEGGSIVEVAIRDK